MAPHVEDARDRLVAMNRPVPEPTAGSDCRERRRGAQPPAAALYRQRCSASSSTDPRWLRRCTSASPLSTIPSARSHPKSPRRIWPSSWTPMNAGQAGSACRCRHAHRPQRAAAQRSASTAPLQMQAPAGGTGVGVEVVSAPEQRRCSRSQRSGQSRSVPPTPSLPAAEKPAEAPLQVNDIKPGENPAQPTTAANQRQTQEAQGRPERRILQQEEKEEGPGQAEPVLIATSIGIVKGPRSNRVRPFHLQSAIPPRLCPLPSLCSPSANLRSSPLASKPFPHGCCRAFRGLRSKKMPHDLPKAYDPTAIEDHWADYWVREKLFAATDAHQLSVQNQGLDGQSL